ncbi:MAG TPA: ShlB/FhaC/HecB family hemolysin secretion/activation protein [Planctomycetota bacterium]|jgi:hemolysin activation/secretion protein
MAISPLPLRTLAPCVAALLLAIAAAAPAPAWAQGRESGQVEQSLKKSDEELRLEKEAPQINIQDKPELKTADDSKVRIKLTSFRITGNVSYPTDELHALVADYEGKEVTLADLRSAANRITMHYRSHGYGLSWAYLPEQVVRDGDIEIAVVEARIDKILVQGNAHYGTGFILDHVAGTANQEALDLDSLERGIYSLNDYPGLSVSARLAPGGAPGTSDLYLQVRDKYPINVSVDWDNFGSEFVAENRGGLTVEAFNLFDLGHWVSVRGVQGFGDGDLSFLTGSYTVPFANGMKFNAWGSYYNYEAVGDLAVFEPLGDGTAFGATLSYPLYRTHVYSLIPEIGYEHKDLTQELFGIQISDDRVRVAVAGVRFEWNDDFNGRWLGSAHLRKGLEGFAGGLEADDPEASRFGAGGDFTKFALTLYRLQRVTSWLHLIGKVNYQFSADPLVVSEQISVGGADSVRGYPAFEVMGDRGYTASIEARIKLPFLDDFSDPFGSPSTLYDMVQLAVFADTGEAELESPTLGEEDRVRLTGAGVGLRLQYPGRASFRLDFGWPVGNRDPSTGDDFTVYFNLIVNLF